MESTCPGCGLRMPQREALPAGETYYNTSAECWSVFTEVLAAEYSNAVLFGQVHQLTVDAYAVQHAGGPHPDKSVDVHLAGLYLTLVRGMNPPSVPPQLQRIVASTTKWPHFEPPPAPTALTVFDVATASTPDEHAARVRAWSRLVWEAWRAHHDGVAALVDAHA